jgi:sugar phosphate isomerase/epimerase
VKIKRRQALKSAAALIGGAFTPALKGAMAAPRPRAERIHIGAQTNIFGVPIKDYDTLLKILDTLARLDYTGFETNANSLKSRFDQAAQCRREFEAHHMRLVALHNGATLYPKEKIPSDIESLRPVASASAEMGAKHIIISDGRLPRTGGKLDLDAVHVWTGGMNELGKAMKAEGVQLCYHNHQLEFEDNPSLMSYLLNETDPKLVMLNFDVGHATGWIDTAAFSREHFRRIAIYHIKDEKVDAEKKHTYTPLGEGQTNLPGVFAPLLNSDWEGWLEIEEEETYPRPAADPEAILTRDREYLKKVTDV